MSQETYPIQMERDVLARMRDGVILRADVFRPSTEGRFPVLLQRTPYNKANYNANGAPFAIRAASQGYVVVLQDVRGRFASDGEWYPFRHELEDGYDTVEWAATLPYSNGRVGMMGWSYLGVTQLFAALAQPPHLECLYPVVTACDYYDEWTYRGGVFQQFFNESWASFRLAPDTLNRRVQKSANAMTRVWNLPLGAFSFFETGPVRELAPYFFDWLRHPSYDGYWKQWSLEGRFGRIAVPAWHVGGWYDIFLNGTLRNYVGIRVHGATEAARRGQRLMIGPWYHDPASFRQGQGGELTFAPEGCVNEEDEMLRWFDYTLKGIANGLEKEKPVRIFVMGENVWREEDEWPPARAQETRYFLHPEVLRTNPPGSDPPSVFVYDPADPVPTSGGGNCCDHDHLAPGVYDQRPIESRDDVLLYSTEPLDAEIEVTGPVTAELYVSTSAVDTDFTAKLVDVHPDGFARNLADGILRLRYRNSFESPELAIPGKIYKITIDLWATSNLFRRGHRIRLEVSSSNFPRYDRNLNTGEDLLTGQRMLRANQTVYHDSEHPSALILPVVPR
ncbi:MAG: CocE/NonD family hydrolase [Bryobacteraceae bacterium]